MSVTTQFVTITLPLEPLPPAAWPQRVEQALRPWGEPLRWAITQVDVAQGVVTVEAVVTGEGR